MKQEQKVAKTRSKIIQAAMQEFGTRGYKSASTNGICEACGISKGLIFYHFKSKEQLFKECAKICIQEFDDYMQQHYIDQQTPLEGIREGCILRKKFFLEHPFYHKIFCKVLYVNDGIGKIESPLRKMYEEHSFHIISRILEGAELNSRVSREENIWIAVKLMEFIDMETYNRLSGSQLMLDEQMKQYEGFLEALLYGILEK